jgi:hypothetical protein
MDDAEGIAIAEAIQCNQRLRELNLSNDDPSIRRCFVLTYACSFRMEQFVGCWSYCHRKSPTTQSKAIKA